MPDFISHLEELRRRIFLCLGVYGVLVILAYLQSEKILDIVTAPLYRHANVQLVFQAPHEAFLIRLKAAALGAAILGVPLFMQQAWLFAAPGLYEREKKVLLPVILASTLLFLAGVFFAYRAVIPWGLGFLLSYQTEALKPMIGIGPYFSFVSGMVTAFGLLFDFPVFMLGLMKLGVVKSRTFAGARKGTYVLIFIAAAVLTPSPDPLSQLLLGIPLILFFEASLWMGRILEKRSGL